MIYPQGGICIHCISTRGHSRHGILPSGHSHHGILSRRHLYSLHTQAGIRIHCILTRGSCIMACTNGTFASWHTLKWTVVSWHAPWEHSHHGIMACSQADIHIMAYPQEGIYIMTYLHEHLHHDIPT